MGAAVRRKYSELERHLTICSLKGGKDYLPQARRMELNNYH